MRVDTSTSNIPQNIHSLSKIYLIISCSEFFIIFHRILFILSQVLLIYVVPACGQHDIPHIVVLDGGHLPALPHHNFVPAPAVFFFVMAVEPVARVVLTFSAVKALKQYLDQALPVTENARKS